MNKSIIFLRTKSKQNRPMERPRVEKELRIVERVVRCAAKGSPDCKEKKRSITDWGEVITHASRREGPGEFTIYLNYS